MICFSSHFNCHFIMQHAVKSSIRCSRRPSIRILSVEKKNADAIVILYLVFAVEDVET